MRKTTLTLSLIGFALLAATNASAAEFFVDPAGGAPANDGSKAKPWQTLEGVVTAGHFGKEIKAGDTVWLNSGYHGAFTVKTGTYAPSITVAAASGQTPQVSQVSLSATHGWVVRGLSVSPSYAPAPKTGGDMVLVDKSCTDVVIEGCDIFSVKDTSSWGATEWINTASSGIFVRGDGITARGNVLTNVRFGIQVDGPNAHIENNQVVNFSADGLRGLGDGDVFEYNLVKNCYVDDAAGDANHDDGFQSWSTGAGGPGTGVVTGVVLRGNVFLNREDPNQKLPNSMQGIGCFDGMFDKWVVENNVVMTDHWHGISFYGMTNSRVVNNTVIDINNVDPGPPWIMVTAHKDGTKSSNVIVRNNLATAFSLDAEVTADHNTTLKDLTAFFVDPAKYDLHLLPGAAAVDTGSADQAPALDADRIARPQGKGVDLGAYEWHEASVLPVDGGTGGSILTGGDAGAGGGPGAAGASVGGGGTTSAGGNAAGTGGTTAGVADASTSAGAQEPPAGDTGGCACRLGARRTPSAAWLLLGLAALLRRKR
jgi:hypothetical protein